MTPRIGHIGTALEIRDDGGHVEDAAELEELGWSALWIAGGQLDRLDRIAEAVRATRRVTVAPSIIPTSEYPSGDVAALYRDLEREHPGRFVAGLGAAQRPRALDALGSYLDELDAADPPVPAGRRLLAALGPRKLALARERFAGALPLLVTPEYTSDARATLGPDRLLVVHQPVVLDDDPARARRTAHGLLEFLLRVRGYPENMLRMGFSEDDVATISDRLVDGVIAWGGPERIAARLAEHRDAGADHLVVSALPGAHVGAMDTARTLAAALLP